MKTLPRHLIVSAILLAFSSVLPAEEKPIAITRGVDLYSHCDLVEWNKQYFVSFLTNSKDIKTDGTIQIYSSKDTRTWEKLATISAPMDATRLYQPALTVSPNGLLMLTASGVYPGDYSNRPLPMYGASFSTLVWYSKDGKKWSDHSRLLPSGTHPNRVTWNEKSPYMFVRGCICGSATTIQMHRVDGTIDSGIKYEETFTGFFPEQLAAVVQDNKLDVIFTRSTGQAGANLPAYYILNQKLDEKDWEWKEMKQILANPSLVRTNDGRIFVACNILEKDPRVVVGELDKEQGIIRELQALPNARKHSNVGLLLKDNALHITYVAIESDKSVNYLKVPLPKK
ncbi:MAG: hypothetical protein R3B84_08355 [Zavarzinella sp.]